MLIAKPLKNSNFSLRDRVKDALSKRRLTLKWLSEQMKYSEGGLRASLTEETMHPTIQKEMWKIIEAEPVIGAMSGVVEKSGGVDKNQLEIEGKVLTFIKSEFSNLPVRKVPFIDFRNIPLNMPLSNLLSQTPQSEILTVDPRAQFAFPMDGMSMYPKIRDGEALYAAYVTDKEDLAPTAMYYVITANHRRVRFLEELPDNKILLKCFDRQTNPDQIIDRSKILELAIITGRYENFLP